MVRSIDEAIGRIEAAEVLDHFGSTFGKAIRQKDQRRGESASRLAGPDRGGLQAGSLHHAGPERRPMARNAGLLGLALGPLDRG